MSNHQLKHDLESVIHEVNNLLGSMAPSSNGIDVSSRVTDALRATQARLSETASDLQSKGMRGARATNAYVHDSPWKAVGMATAFGLVVGLLATRLPSGKSSKD
ncbi:MAG: hypothetical protein RJB60_2341 [Pseudomonadota bacterium]|jgi:ElaB/YqjD/DUF883 family membrane-anchored ribosome-binding protein